MEMLVMQDGRKQLTADDTGNELLSICFHFSIPQWWHLQANVFTSLTKKDLCLVKEKNELEPKFPETDVHRFSRPKDIYSKYKKLVYVNLILILKLLKLYINLYK